VNPFTVIRVDAGAGIGGGHVSRCLAIASQLRRLGHDLLFVCRPHAGHLGERIREAGYEVRLLPPPGEPVDPTDYSTWVGATVEDDARQTIEAMDAAGRRADWIVVDHYGLDCAWESFAGNGARVLAIDDLANRSHDCDVLVDQNVVAGMDSRYSELIPARASRLLGPAFALLGPEFAGLHAAARPRTCAQRLLAFFGATDPHGMTERFLKALRLLEALPLQVDLVLPFDYPGTPEVGDRRLTVHRALPSLAPLLAVADIALGAGGVTNWERLCLGLPSLVVATAENQVAICQELHRRQLIHFLGWHDDVGSEAFAKALRAVVETAPLQEWSERCLRVVDGEGARRVAASMVLGNSAELRARPAASTDEDLLLAWANDPVTRRNAFSTSEIAPSDHSAWFARRLARPDASRIFIIENAGGIPVGQARFEREEEDWVIDYSVAPAFRGLGLGGKVLGLALRRLAALSPQDRVVGLVKSGNEASARVFESLAFEAAPLGHALQYRRALKDFL
jgi:UDP-2,4-diacetamido-2,4,6-trideoxy-beta-L-altropyranose hydrolase